MSATIGTGERGTIWAETLSRVTIVAGAAHDVRPGPRERVDLLERAFDVGRLGGGHRLHRYGRVTADLDRPDAYLAGDPTRAQGAGSNIHPSISAGTAVRRIA